MRIDVTLVIIFLQSLYQRFEGIFMFKAGAIGIDGSVRTLGAGKELDSSDSSSFCI